ncbi:MAG: Bro-N domain-containing protein [Arsenophonus endosymbiont of Dermacentor nuttalli]
MTNLKFRNTLIETIAHDGEIWFSSTELAKALEYTETDAVTKIFNRNKNEVSECMTTTVNLGVVRKTGTVGMRIRIFSLRGAHLVAMFARTPVAKEFRRWVLDILDKEVGNPQPSPEAAELLNDNDTRNLAHLVWSMANGFRFEKTWTQGIWYALRHATGVASPQHFEVNQLPIIAEDADGFTALLTRSNQLFSILKSKLSIVYSAIRKIQRLYCVKYNNY